MTTAVLLTVLAAVVFAVGAARRVRACRRAARPDVADHHAARHPSSIDLHRRIPAQRGPQPPTGQGPTRHRSTTRRTR